MKTVLFQGDSITDSGRFTEGTLDIGHGYPAMVAAYMGEKYPQKYKFIDRAVSGNRIVDVYARVKRDIINLKPDYLSLMIGINDVWHDLGDDPNGVETPRFQRVYDELMSVVTEALPETKIILMSPYYTEKTVLWDKNFKLWVTEKAEIAKEMSKKYKTAFIDTQMLFDKAVKRAPLEYWTADGVHPTMFGHKLIANEYVKVFSEMEGLKK